MATTGENRHRKNKNCRLTTFCNIGKVKPKFWGVERFSDKNNKVAFHKRQDMRFVIWFALMARSSICWSNKFTTLVSYFTQISSHYRYRIVNHDCTLCSRLVTVPNLSNIEYYNLQLWSHRYSVGVANFLVSTTLKS